MSFDGIYLYSHDSYFKPSQYHYDLHCLAVGLGQIGVPVFSNIQDLDAQFLDINSIQDDLLYVFQITQTSNSYDYLEMIINCPVKNKFILSIADDNAKLIAPAGIPALLAHGNRFYRVCGGPRIPWAFGLSDSVLAKTESVVPITARDVCLLRNFRPSANQGVRDALDLVLLPHLKAALPVVSDLKEPEVYFETLKNSFGCLAYGGNFHCDLSRNEVLMQLEEGRSASIYFQFVVEPVIVRWDSWRFWESLAAGCLTFHLDFEKYGFVLPVMPQAWVHYVPIDLSDPKGTVSALMDRWDELPAIAAQGRLWAREHYSPEAVAYRFLDYALGNLPMPEALTPEMLERENRC